MGNQKPIELNLDESDETCLRVFSKGKLIYSHFIGGEHHVGHTPKELNNTRKDIVDVARTLKDISDYIIEHQNEIQGP